MANEFKVRKGLIVEGSGSAILDIQGSQGQLFSITDDLTGDLFSVSDISGIPILNVNADGTTTIDGTLTLTTDATLDTTSDTSIKFLTRDSNGVVKYHTLGSNAFNSNTYNNYSLPLGTASARGGFKIGYTESGKNYPVELSSEKMYVNVPWTDTNTVYTHPTHPGDDINIDTTALTGATVISDLDFNITTDTSGHVTDANGTVATRTLTLLNLGFTGDTDANHYTFPYTVSAAASNSTVVQRNSSGYIFGSFFNGSGTFSTSGATSGMGLFTGTNGTDTYGRSYTAAAARALLDVAEGATNNTGTLTGNGTSTYIPFYTGATTFGNTNKLTWDGSKVTMHGLKLTGVSTVSSTKGLAIDGNGDVGYVTLGSNAFNSTTIPSLSGNVTVGGDLTVSGNQVITAGVDADVKLSVWSGTTYGIGMTSGVTLGSLNDYAMTFCMNNDSDRGFWWGYSGQAKSAGAMSLTTGGNLYVSNQVQAQETYIARDSYFERLVTLNQVQENESSTKALVWADDETIEFRGLGSAAFSSVLTGDGNYGMTTSGTSIRMEDDRRRNSSTTDIYTGNTHDFTWYDADVGIRWYTAGAEEMRLENDGDLHVDGDVIAFSSTVSDERLKDNVTTIENPLDKIKALRGVEYDWNDGSRKGKHDLGLIAQEVEKVIPNIVHEHQMPLLNDDEEDETLYKTVDYEKLTAVLIEGMKEQQNQIDSLKSELAKIKGSL